MVYYWKPLKRGMLIEAGDGHAARGASYRQLRFANLPAMTAT